jgi:signal transduction histidine kinase
LSQLRWRTKTIYMNQPRSSFTAKKRVSFGVFSESHPCLIAFPDNMPNYHKPNKTRVSTNSASSPAASFFAHELRNPLTNINLAIDLLDLTTTDIDQKEFIDVIRRSSARINILINEFIKCQKVEEIIEEKHSLNQLLDEVLEMAQDRIALKNIRIIKAYETEDGMILMQRPKIKMALTNIIINAIDAMASVDGELRLVTNSNEDEYSIEIEDNGCGISKENLKYIFKPYFTNKPGGLGMGLAATDSILRSNHVEVHVQSVEGKGTKFTLLFRKNIYTELLTIKKWTETLQVI